MRLIVALVQKYRSRLIRLNGNARHHTLNGNFSLDERKSMIEDFM
jgi:hypothetical protein